jgi:hypothetical protein
VGRCHIESLSYHPIQRLTRRVHDHVLCAGEFLDGVAGSVVIPVRVADQKDLDVTEFEAKLFHLARISGTFSSISLLIRM